MTFNRLTLRDVQSLWRSGFDTSQIAKLTAVEEWIIYNYLAQQREKRRKAA